MTKALSRTAKSTKLAAMADATTLLSALMESVDAAAAIEKKGNNADVRKAAFKKAIAEGNKLATTEVAVIAAELVPVAEKLIAQSEAIEAQGGMTDEEAVVAMQSVLGGKLIGEFKDAMYEVARQQVFSAMTASAAEMGEEVPEQVSMVFDVPSLGKRFCREAVGRKTPTVDFVKLREIVGEELFATLTTEKVTVTTELDEAALIQASADHPGLLEQVRSAIKPGDWKSPRLSIRDIPASEIEQE